MANETASAKFERLQDGTHRKRAERFAYFTIPRLMKDVLRTDSEDIIHDYQSFGAVLVNNLSAKLGTALFPPNRPNFRITLSREVKRNLVNQGMEEDKLATDVAALERDSSARLFLNSGYSKLIRALQLLIVTGNALVYRDSVNGNLMVWSLQSFVVERRPDGKLQTAVLKQKYKYGMLSEEQQQAIAQQKPDSYKPDTTVDLYTVIQRHPGTADVDIMTVAEEVDGVAIGAVSTYPEHLCPWFAPVWNLADGEHYARGLVEDYSGDFGKYSMLSEQMGMYEIESMNMLNLVDESTGAAVDDLQEANTGDYVPGKAAGVVAYDRGDYNKMATIANSLGRIEQRLQIAFMYTGQMRDAERVTAAEVQLVAQEADNALGGAYSQLAASMQEPLAYLCMGEVNVDLVPAILSRDMRPDILTGVPALGRVSESQNLLQTAQEVGVVVPAMVQSDPDVDPRKIVALLARNNGVAYDDLKKSPEQLQQEAEAQQQAALQAQMQGNPEQTVQAAQQLGA